MLTIAISTHRPVAGEKRATHNDLAAIFNGLTAPPLILLIIILSRLRGVFGEFRSGWTSLIATTVAGIAMTAFPLIALIKA